MFDKLTKKFASKTTESALEGVTQTLNEKVGPHIDMIQIGLVFGVIALGTHITKRAMTPHAPPAYIPTQVPNGQPITINNYYREREEYHNERKQRSNCYIQDGKAYRQPPQKAYSKR